MKGRRMRRTDLVIGAFEFKGFWLPCCCNCNVAMGENFLDQMVAEASTGTCNKENSRHCD